MTKGQYKSLVAQGFRVGNARHLIAAQPDDTLAYRPAGGYAAAQLRLAELEAAGAQYDAYDALSPAVRAGIFAAQYGRRVRAERARVADTHD